MFVARVKSNYNDLRRLVEAVRIKRIAEIGDEPLLSPPVMNYWRAALAKASVYVEYGCGGSTVLASKLVDRIIAVDSDRCYAKAVSNKAKGNRATVKITHADIGLVGEFGYPVFQRPTKKNLERWERYISSPWTDLGDVGETPDLVLVDGRFRVACVLKSLLSLPSPSTCRFILDDYRERQEHYSVIFRFITDVECIDRAIAFAKRADLDTQACREAYARHISHFH